MMKKIGYKVEKGSLEHIVDWDTFMNDDELRKKYCDVKIEKIAYQPYNIMTLDEFIEFERKCEKEFKREDID